MNREAVAEKYQWNTGDVFLNDEAWEEAFRKLEKTDFGKYKGTLNCAENVLKYFKAEEDYEIALLRVYLYAHMKHDEDVGNTKYSSCFARVMTLFARVGAETAFATPELTALPEEKLREFAADKRLTDYDYFFTRLIAEKKHVLSEGEERILAKAEE